MPPNTRTFGRVAFLYDRAAQAVFPPTNCERQDQDQSAQMGFFGGQSEGNETHIECFIREFEEEIGLKVRPEGTEASA